MRKSPAVTLVLIIAFAINASGGVLAVACPGAFRECCARQAVTPPARADERPSCQHEMAGMDMDDMDMDDMDADEQDASDSSSIEPNHDLLQAGLAAPAVLTVPAETCPHCLTHSEPLSSNANVVNISSTQRSAERSAAAIISKIDFSLACKASLKAWDHGPPIRGLPRHLLINVFRI